MDILNTSTLWKYLTKPPVKLPELEVLKEIGHSIRWYLGAINTGKNVTVNINITPFKPIDLKAKAGETVSFSISGIDSIIGFLELN